VSAEPQLAGGVVAKHLLILIASSCVVFAFACGLDTQPTNLAPSIGQPGVGGASGGRSSNAAPRATSRPDEDPPDVEDDAKDDAKADGDGGDDRLPAEVDGDDMSSADATCDATSCDDGDACTRDVEMTRKGKCMCSHTPITRMRDGDHCCPPGAGPDDDADCGRVAACGNGKVDPGEECDGGGECGRDCSLLFAGSLVHRYSFEGDGEALVDSVGHADGKVVNGRLRGEGDLVLPGALVYGELPRGLISGLTSATIEFWITTVRGGGGQRVFDFGNDTLGQAATYWAMTPSSILDGNAMTIVNVTPELDALSQGDQYASGSSPVESGTMLHFAVVFDDEARTLSLYMEGRLQGALRSLDGHLSDIDDSNAWLGRGQSDGFPFLNGRIHEFRIYDQALTAAMITRSFAAGPDPK
jgi:hypothetical protein